MNWEYGITTVPQRFKDSNHLINTIGSLKQGGFEKPKLFIDGGTFEEAKEFAAFVGLEFTHRHEPLKTAGNWLLSILELFIRSPKAERYAIFQDDLICCTNLKSYLEQSKYPTDGYLNLYLFSSNMHVKPKEVTSGWFRSNQLGRGAVALVFSRDALRKLLTQVYLYDRFDRDRGHLSIDGTICDAMNNAGWSEYVHYPSLTLHTGIESTVGHPQFDVSVDFPGESFDARNLFDASWRPNPLSS